MPRPSESSSLAAELRRAHKKREQRSLQHFAAVETWGCVGNKRYMTRKLERNKDLIQKFALDEVEIYKRHRLPELTTSLGSNMTTDDQKWGLLACTYPPSTLSSRG